MQIQTSLSLLPRWSAIPPAQGEHARAWAVVQTRSAAGHHLSPIDRFRRILVIRQRAHLQDVPCISHSLPVIVCEGKCRPPDLLFNLTIPVNGCDWAVKGISRSQIKIDYLGQCQCHVRFITIETNIIQTWRSLYERSSMRCADPHQILLWRGIRSASGILHWIWSLSKYSMR